MTDAQRDHLQALTDAVGNDETFLRLTMTGKFKDQNATYEKVVVRPITLKNRRFLQFSYFDGKKDITKNYQGAQVQPAIAQAFEMPFRQFHVQTTEFDLRVQIDKHGEARLSRSKPSLKQAPDLTHNRRKNYLHSGPSSRAFLREIDITDAAGNVKPTMQAKYRQIHEFLSRIDSLILDRDDGNTDIEIIDCGCGSAYLTFAAYNYLKNERKRNPRVMGVDRERAVIEKCLTLRDNLGWDGLDFTVSDIARYTPERQPDMVLSLHACNTATDEAIARGIEWQCETIVVAPCCQHELRSQLQAPSMHAMLRYGLLKQRTAEIVTDAVRAQILRIMGYKTSIVEFVFPSHTPKNLMIRAQKVRERGNLTTIQEYLELKRFWHVEPSLERLLGESFQLELERADADT